MADEYTQLFALAPSEDAAILMREIWGPSVRVLVSEPIKVLDDLIVEAFGPGSRFRPQQVELIREDVAK